MHSQIHHQNVIPLLGVWRDSEDGPPLMVMPFAENGSALAYLQGDNGDAVHCATIVNSFFSSQIMGNAVNVVLLHSVDRGRTGSVAPTL